MREALYKNPAHKVVSATGVDNPLFYNPVINNFLLRLGCNGDIHGELLEAAGLDDSFLDEIPAGSRTAGIFKYSGLPKEVPAAYMKEELDNTIGWRSRRRMTRTNQARTPLKSIGIP